MIVDFVQNGASLGRADGLEDLPETDSVIKLDGLHYRINRIGLTDASNEIYQAEVQASSKVRCFRINTALSEALDAYLKEHGFTYGHSRACTSAFLEAVLNGRTIAEDGYAHILISLPVQKAVSD